MKPLGGAIMDSIGIGIRKAKEALAEAKLRAEVKGLTELEIATLVRVSAEIEVLKQQWIKSAIKAGVKQCNIAKVLDITSARVSQIAKAHRNTTAAPMAVECWLTIQCGETDILPYIKAQVSNATANNVHIRQIEPCNLLLKGGYSIPIAEYETRIRKANADITSDRITMGYKVTIGDEKFAWDLVSYKKRDELLLKFDHRARYAEVNSIVVKIWYEVK